MLFKKKTSTERQTDVISFSGSGDGEIFLYPPNVTRSTEPEEKAPQKVAQRGWMQTAGLQKGSRGSGVAHSPRALRDGAVCAWQHHPALTLPAAGPRWAPCSRWGATAPCRAGCSSPLPAALCLQGLRCRTALAALPSARHSLALLLSNSARFPKSQIPTLASTGGMGAAAAAASRGERR